MVILETVRLRNFLPMNFSRTKSGTFMDGDLLVNKDGVRIVSQTETEAVRYFYCDNYIEMNGIVPFFEYLFFDILGF